MTGASVATGLVGLLLLIAANGPVPATQVAHASDPEGFAIVSFFVTMYAWAAVAVRLPEDPWRPLGASSATGLGRRLGRRLGRLIRRERNA